MNQWKIVVESTIITKHMVEGETADEAARNAIKLASQKIPGADDRQISEMEEIE